MDTSSGRSADRADTAQEQAQPWDIGEPQPDLVSLVDRHPPGSPILDAGCGTGDLAIALARRGKRVLGIDIAESAVDRAREKAGQESPDVRRILEFRVTDALHPTQLREKFGAVVDSGFYHVFDPARRQEFVSELARSIAEGGRYYMIGFAEEVPDSAALVPVTEEELRSRFTEERGWQIAEVADARFRTRGGTVGALVMCAERLAAD